jgi:sugar/nucleoside kinase (ribokinase family)
VTNKGNQRVASFDVSVIGELNLDLILYGLPPGLVLEREHLASDLSITLGSSAAIFAHNLAVLGNKVGFNSCIGDDPFGEICVQRLSAGGVDVSHVRKLRGKTTGLSVILPQVKERYIMTYPGTMYEMADKDLDPDYLFDAKHLHLSSYFLQKGLQPHLPDIFRKAKEAGLTTSLDTNDDPEGRWSGDIHLLLPHLDILLLNERELRQLTRVEDVDKAAEALSAGIGLIVVKRGSQGAIALAGRTKYVATPLAVDVVDCVGAGDSFDAGFIHQFTRARNIQECLRFANIAGALSVTRAGGTEAFRDSQHCDAFLRKHAGGMN